MKVFVINLRADKEKKNRMIKILSKFSFKYNFIEAFDGKKISIKKFYGYNDFKRKLFFGRSLLPKELGILESHKKILQIIVKKNIRQALIFEDDISFNDKFEKYLNLIIKNDYPWELVRFLESEKLNMAFGKKVVKLDDNVSLKRFPKLYGGAHAYLINNSGARKILEQIKNFYYPIDLIMAETWKKNLNSLVCNPGLVWQEKMYNIDPPDSTRFIKIKKNILNIYPYSRLIFKIYETLLKWLHFIYMYFYDLIKN